MSRCIDADALKKKIRKDYHPTDEIPFFEIMHIISDAPTIEERPKGKWITWREAGNDIASDDRHECSYCHDSAQWLSGGFELLSNFCPNCGADMRGDV